MSPIPVRAAGFSKKGGSYFGHIFPLNSHPSSLNHQESPQHCRSKKSRSIRLGFLRRQDENLDPAQVRRLITALDEKCRTLDF